MKKRRYAEKYYRKRKEKDIVGHLNLKNFLANFSHQGKHLSSHCIDANRQITVYSIFTIAFSHPVIARAKKKNNILDLNQDTCSLYLRSQHI